MRQHRFQAGQSGKCILPISRDFFIDYCDLEENHPIHIGSIRSLSLGEQPHGATGCDLRGRPHLGPCIDPVYQRLLVVGCINNYGIVDSSENVNELAKRIVNTLSEYRIGESTSDGRT